MKRQDQPFLVGRRTRRGTTVMVLREQGQPLFRGPWTVRAVVSAVAGGWGQTGSGAPLGRA